MKSKIYVGAGAMLVAACQSALPGEVDQPAPPISVAMTLSTATSTDGQYISWREHLIDDQQTNGGIPIRGGDGLATADIDRDGHMDIVSVHEDSNHLRIAFGTGDPDIWRNVTIGEGAEVAAIEDVAIGDLNGDGWLDLVGACEEAHLVYFQNPGEDLRTQGWSRLIPEITQGRGSWLRVFVADMNMDGRLDILAANKGTADIIDPSAPASQGLPTSLFTISGDPLVQESWSEHVLSREVVPNTAMPVDIDADGDLDVLSAARLHQTMTILENVDPHAEGGVEIRPHPITIAPGFPVEEGWSARSSAFQTVFADMNGDARKDLVVSVFESTLAGTGTALLAGLGWLQQPENLDQPWIYFPIGNTRPDAVVGIALADIDGDGDMDAITGGYSGLNVLQGGYSGASRDFDDARVSAASTLGRIAWFENPGDARLNWRRHDVSRRVRGMYDGFIPHDMDGDGDVDLIATRGNSGEFDGVFWLEQVRSDAPQAAFTPARTDESRAMALPPENWIDLYDLDVTFVAPNKVDSEQ